ncbi:MAG TPA: helicase-related protein [Rhodospirillales bacterium]
MQIDTSAERSRIVAVLGPTNTGKTHLAMERLLGHASGMIGFPLRLLARENYDRAVAAKGKNQVALITGEEKIVPAGARYFLCTAESMPLDRDVAFVGIDEIQMCADPDRGHVFTDRLLSARGRDETMFMGSDVVKPLLRQLVPDAEFMSRPRLSTLSYTGERKTTRLPPRTAVVAFSAAEVYTLAELVRRQRGGAAVVLGALSPRTRNAQVAMYQQGEVDYLVATDAIGMGLNMDVDHVAFAATRKFDGRQHRTLTPVELAQTAGRAGRHMNDGTFGTTGGVGPLDPDVALRIENHHFEPLRFLYWRNPRLDFSSLAALQRSLAEPPTIPGLIRAREADDERALHHLCDEPEIVALAATRNGLRLLWDVCQIPDFGKVMSDAHARLLGQIYRHLMGPEERIPTDWMAAQVARLDRADGDIETLAARIAGIRIWTYVAYHADWLADASHWQERTRGIEDKLSDALHQRLTQRFVDRRTAILVSRLKDTDDLLAAVNAAGEVTVEGHHAGRLDGFRFTPDCAGDGAAAKAAAGAVARAMKSEIEARLHRLEADDDSRFALAADESGWPRRIAWRGAEVARLAAGPDLLKPQAQPLASALLDSPAKERLRRRLQAWLDGRVAAAMAPLKRAAAAAVDGPARGILFQLTETLGTLDRDAVEGQIEALGRAERKTLRCLGVRIGRRAVYMPELVKADAMAMRGLLWVVRNDPPKPPAPPDPARVSLPVEANAPFGFYRALGLFPYGRLAVRVDMVERLANRAWSLAEAGDFAATPELLSLAGCGADDMAAILKGLGYWAVKDAEGVVRFRRAGARKARPGRDRDGKRQRKAKPASDDSPFAKLRRLTAAR